MEVHLLYYINVEAACFICEHNYDTATNLSNHIQAQHSDWHSNITPGATLNYCICQNKYLDISPSNYTLSQPACTDFALSTLSDMLNTLQKSPEAMPK